MKGTKTTKTAIALAAAISLIATGCSSPSKDGAKETPTANGGGGQKTEGQKVKLTMGSWRTEDKEVYEKIIKAFNKANPDIEIEFKPTKNTEYNTVLNTALQTGSGPDIIHLRPYAAGIALADANYLEPLASVKGLEAIPKEAKMAATGKDGKVYGVPTVYSSTQIFYNKTLFKKFNLSEPKTWDELMKAADTLKQNKITPFAFGSKEGWILSLTHGALGPQFYGGTEFVNNLITGKMNFKSKEFTDSITMFQGLTKYFPENYTGLGMDDMRNLFVTEQAGMIVMGDWEIAVMKKMNPDLDLDLFPVPPVKADGKASVTNWVDGSFAVNAASKNKQAALKFIEFMTTKEFGKMVADDLKKPSTIPGVESSDPLVAKMIQLAAANSTPYAMVVHFSAGNPTTKATLETTLQGMFLGKEKPDTVTDIVQKSADSWFKPAAK
ncbi:raffinose/stachyose/melibiose transport system substrate-binding protein [Paenibacillus tianmuensis]|uniref:Raffinose/stachyose/melibiose transport system substrate-binding protein n=1 Tax=Paenibacillus tianmuensis TaxID=624147 RepID=A0A1G4PXE7_9BACL|nr:extracellular solute-binding protein [Paenibacillus tianmuensis]SCW36748.1 raffinose/stachyose/melibiose transport system substrate-binding protein [Paenibacillus tianmuensis]